MWQGFDSVQRQITYESTKPGSRSPPLGHTNQITSQLQAHFIIKVKCQFNLEVDPAHLCTQPKIYEDFWLPCYESAKKRQIEIGLSGNFQHSCFELTWIEINQIPPLRRFSKSSLNHWKASNRRCSNFSPERKKHTSAKFEDCAAIFLSWPT